MSGAVSSLTAGMLGNAMSSSSKAAQASAMVLYGGLSGGVSSHLAGGSFGQGFSQGIITAGLNHAMHAGADAMMDSKPILSVIVSEGTLSGNNTSSYTNGAAGHVALRVDDIVYSFEGSGEWTLYDYKKYLAYEKQHRNLTEFFINADVDDIQRSLSLRENGIYDLENNNCVTNTMNLLKDGGLRFNPYNGIITPMDFATQLPSTNAVRATYYYSTRTCDFYSNLTGGLKVFSNFNFNTNKLYKR